MNAWTYCLLSSLLLVGISFVRADADSPQVFVVVNTAIPESPVYSLGFAMESEGFLITTYQQILEPGSERLSTQLTVRTAAPHSGQPHPARIIGVEPTLNFAVIKFDPVHPLEPLNLIQPETLTPGSPIQGFHLEAKSGQPLPMTGQFLQMNSKECYQFSLTETMLRARLPLPDSGLGSPVINAAGDAFAIHTGYIPLGGRDEDDAGVNFLLPSTLIQTTYAGIKNRKNLESPWTGFSVRRLSEDELAEYPKQGPRFKGGIGLEHIWPNSPAEALGIEIGDQLVQFGFYPIQSVPDFQRWLYMYGVGQTVKLYFMRGEEMRVVEYTIEKRPDWATPQ